MKYKNVEISNLSKSLDETEKLWNQWQENTGSSLRAGKLEVFTRGYKV